MGRRIMKLGPAHIRVAQRENALPGNLDIVEENERIVFVEAGRQRIVKLADGAGLERLARQQVDPFCGHRQRA